MGKKLLVALLVVLVLVGGVIYVGGAFIDPNVQVGTESHLAAPPAAVFAHLDNVAGLTRWWTIAPPPEMKEGMQSPPKMSIRKIGGPDQGPGMMVVFEMDGRVMETWTLKTSEPPGRGPGGGARVVYEVDFAKMMKVERTLTLTPDEEGTRVTWRETGVIEKPPYRWMKVLMSDEQVTKSFEAALGALGKAAKSAP